MRRRQRRLRSWWRHEPQSIAAVLGTFCTTLPHGDRRWPGPDRRWSTQRTTLHEDGRDHVREGRPGILAEPGPQRSDCSRQRSSGEGLPLLATPSLAGAAKVRTPARSSSSLPLALRRKKEKEQVRRWRGCSRSSLTPSKRRVWPKSALGGSWADGGRRGRRRNFLEVAPGSRVLTSGLLVFTAC